MRNRDRQRSALRSGTGRVMGLERLEARIVLSGDGPYPLLDGGSPLVADFNNDGHLDVITVRGNNSILLHLADGQGGFETMLASTNRRLPTLSLADLNGDAYLDLVFAAGWHVSSSHTPPSYSVRLRALVFEPATNTFSIGASLRLEEFFIGAIAGAMDDSPPDEVVLVTSAGTRVLRLGTATNQWEEVAGLQFSDQLVFETRAGGDLNGDGLLDLVGIRRIDGSTQLVVSYRTPDGPTAFSEPMVISSAPGVVRINSVIDVDGDGDLDILGTSSGPNTVMSVFHVVLFNNNGDGSFDPGRTIWRQRAPAGHQVTGLVVATTPSGEARADIRITTRDLDFTNPQEPLTPDHQRYRVIALSVDGLGEVFRQRLPLAWQNVRSVGDLTPTDGEANQIILWSSASGMLLVHDLAGDSTIPMAFGRLAWSQHNQRRFGNGSTVTIQGDLFDPRIFEHPPTPIRTIYAVFVDTNGNGVIDPEDIRVGRERVNPRRNPHPNVEFMVSEELPRGRFHLLVRAINQPGGIVGPAWRIAQQIEFI